MTEGVGGAGGAGGAQGGEDEAPTWDLEVLCPAGPGGETFRRRRDALSAILADLRRRIDAVGLGEPNVDAFAQILLAVEGFDRDHSDLVSFACCAASADSRSAEARAAEADADELIRGRDLLGAEIAARIDAMDDDAFAALIARPDLADLAPSLSHARAGRRLRLAPALAALKIEMDREALTGWGRLYDQVSGDLVAEVGVGAARRTVGIAEASGMRAHPDAAERRAAFEGQAAAWTSVRAICAHTLTQIVGSRSQHYARLGVDELAETLHDNRVDAALIDAMWAAADAARPALIRYLRHKAALFGKDALDWYDLDAPLQGGGRAWGWRAATAEIVGAFEAFHPELAAFARGALADRWVDARPREGRRPGGFCTGFPAARASRIFMTFTGSIDSATTLAHELGHAWHNHVLDGQTPARCLLTQALAETASTFAEAIFRDRVLRSADDRQTRAFMLDQQLQAAAGFLMDIPHRFAFERALYGLRREGVLDADALSEEIVAIQRRCYGDALASYDPLFWCSKLHFYIPEGGFYNWPYAFGYLFSSAVYARAVAAGPAFLDPLKDLLRRTGWQDTAELGREVLGVDLRSPDFWRGIVSPIDGLVDDFVDATA